MVSRRHTMLAGGTVILTSLGISTIPDRSSAVELTGDFQIPDADKEITEPVSGVTLDVSGSLEWDADTSPTRAIIRLEVSRTGSFEQLGVIQFDSDLTRSDSRDFDESLNLLDHSQIDANQLSPTTTGETESINLSGRISVELSADGHTLATEDYETSFGINVEKTLGTTEISLGATGEVTIS